MSKPIDLTGQRFGHWTVLSRAENDRRGNTRWLCQCDCGRQGVVSSPNLKTGASRSCGCRDGIFVDFDLTGKRFGRLLVIKKIDDKEGDYWHCRCDCGVEKDIIGRSLRKGVTQSCGCRQHDIVRTRNTTHGETNTRLNRIWRGMKTRCYNKNRKEYERYGGRGITVCDEWLHDFEAFRDWALSHGYRDDLSIDRIDNDNGYSPTNCRWATMKEQSNNRATRKDAKHHA